eukprot:m.834258 g.834258  ORF g.834258 m.834258 type:complete len:849 (+) comp23445_c0_seq3:152-2698(+)
MQVHVMRGLSCAIYCCIAFQLVCCTFRGVDSDGAQRSQIELSETCSGKLDLSNPLSCVSDQGDTCTSNDKAYQPCAQVQQSNDPTMPNAFGMKFCVPPDHNHVDSLFQGNGYAQMDWSSGFTFATWVKLLQPYQVSVAFCFQGNLADKGDLQNGNFALHTPFSNGYFKLQSFYATKECPLSKQDLNGCMLQSNEILPTGVWQHWTFTYDGKLQRIYVNGNNISSTTPPAGAMQTSSYPLNLGITINDYGDFYPGIKFSAVRVYQRALSTEDVQSIANANETAGGKIPIRVNQNITAYYDFSDPFCFGRNQKSTLCTVDVELHSMTPYVVVREKGGSILLKGVGFAPGATLTIGEYSASLVNITKIGAIWSAEVPIPSHALQCGEHFAVVAFGTCRSSRNVSAVVVSSTISLANGTETTVPVNTSVGLAVNGECFDTLESATCSIRDVTVPARILGPTQLVCNGFVVNSTGENNMTLALTVVSLDAEPSVVLSSTVDFAVYGPPVVRSIAPNIVADDVVPKIFNISGSGFSPGIVLSCRCEASGVSFATIQVPARFVTDTLVRCPVQCLATDLATLTPGITRVTIDQGIFASSTAGDGAWVTVTPGNVSAPVSYVSRTVSEAVHVGEEVTIGILHTMDAMGAPTNAPPSCVQVVCNASVCEQISLVQGNCSVTISVVFAATGAYSIGVLINNQSVSGPLEVTVSQRCPANCSGIGYCTNEGSCICPCGYEGVDCSSVATTISPTPLPCPAACSGHGTCAQGTCVCDCGFVGQDCSIAQALIPSVCSGRGIRYLGTCFCDDGWGGASCEIQYRAFALVSICASVVLLCALLAMWRRHCVHARTSTPVGDE